MRGTKATLVLLLLALVFTPFVAHANAGDYSGAVAIESGYAGTSSAPSNGLIVEGNTGIGTASPGSKLDVKGTLRLSGSTSGYVGFTPAAAAGSTTYTLPSADGSSGQVLSTNGSGTLSWATGGGGSSQWTTTGSDIYYNTGEVGIGTTSPLSALYIDAATGPSNFIRLHDGSPDYGVALGISSTGGDFVISPIHAGTTTEAFRIVRSSGNIKIASFGSATSTTVCQLSGVLSSCSSSKRYKENVKPATFGLKEVMAMQPVTFKWKGREEKDFGLIAEDVEKINPLFVTYKNRQVEGVKYPQLTATLIRAIQELRAEFEAYKTSHP